MLKREEYLNQLIKFKDINLIKVITGVRRSGKSTLLLQFKDYLLKHEIKKENVLYMNFESAEWYDITNYKELFNYIKSKKNKEKLYILLDEVQNVDQWEKAVNSLLVDLDCDIYITGSNAYLLSSELTTLLAGRIITIKIYPFSFKEFTLAYPFKEKDTIEDKFNKYLKFGGMPMIINMDDDADLVTKYLQDIKEVVLKKDVIARNKINDIALLDNLLAYMASTIGNLVSPSGVTEYLNKNGRNTHHETIDSYLKMLENAYIIYRVPRYELNGKQLLKTQGKYYMVDTGIKNSIISYSSYNSGSSLENVVYLELLRRGYNVTVGVFNNIEVDFVAQKENETIYYQVTRTLLDERVEEREKKSLLALKDNYKKVIITMDNIIPEYTDGIEVINIIDFLLN